MDNAQFNLAGAQLRAANLNYANLKGVLLLDTSLNNSHFSKANLQEAKLYRVDLQRTNLYGVNLQDTYLANDLYPYLTFAGFYWQQRGRDYYAGNLDDKGKDEFEEHFNPPKFDDCYMYDDDGEEVTDLVQILDSLIPKPEDNENSAETTIKELAET